MHVPSADCEYNGMRFELGERFPSPRDPCAECVCQAGSVECLSRVCAIPNCPSPTYSPGSCCPVCLGKSQNGDTCTCSKGPTVSYNVSFLLFKDF